MKERKCVWDRGWAKCTVRVSKHHCSQTFSTHLGGWEGRRPVRRGCGVTGDINDLPIGFFNKQHYFSGGFAGCSPVIIFF